jgi:hypothetical protein
MSNRDVGFNNSAESITIFGLNKTATFAVESMYKKSQLWLSSILKPG